VSCELRLAVWEGELPPRETTGNPLGHTHAGMGHCTPLPVRGHSEALGRGLRGKKYWEASGRHSREGLQRGRPLVDQGGVGHHGHRRLLRVREGREGGRIGSSDTEHRLGWRDCW
jgi:hypothetical protein